ncbi:hypothetical protein OPQ81_010615 [Rhizoctonia solani]|nr:hypothetical protein OPQ81_010615 [Rhizoctonia solani]
MGHRAPNIAFSPLYNSILQKPGDGTSEPESVNAGVNDHAEIGPEVVRPSATNLAGRGTSPLVLVRSIIDRTMTVEEEEDYDMCTLWTNTQDDDYVLVASGPILESPEALSGGLNKGREIPEK